jgi:glycosyltransferase involved in cell wall biosynthesis
MRIAIDCRFIGNSGIGTYLDNILNELLNHHTEHDYLLIIRNQTVIDCKRDNVHVLVCDIKPFSVRDLLFFPVSEVNKCDVFFSPYFNVPLRIKIPVFVTIHDVIFMDRRELTSWLGYQMRKLFLKYAIFRSKKIFTVSDFSRRRIVYHFHLRKEIIVTYNDINFRMKDKCGVDFDPVKKGNYIIYVGNIKKHKGLEVLLSAYIKAKERGYHNKLYVVGNSDNLRTADEEVSKMVEMDKDIHFTGYVTDDQLYNYIKGAQCLVLPSFYEGFGIPPLEALYLGTNVILSDIEVLKEIYSDYPVTFFKVGDVDGLSEKLLAYEATSFNCSEIRNKIEKKFDSSIVCSKVLAGLESH